MMASSKWKQGMNSNRPANLHNLVEAAFHAHKKDIRAFAGGHLNPNKLAKLPAVGKDDNTKIWKSSESQKETGYRQVIPTDSEQLDAMANSLLDFSLGSASIIPIMNEHYAAKSSSKTVTLREDLSPLPLVTTSDELLEEKLVEHLRFAEKAAALSKSSYRQDFSVSNSNKSLPPLKKTKTKVYIEELKLPEVMLSSINTTLGVPPSLQDNSSEQAIRQLYEKKKFVTTHHAGVTKKDQFLKMIDFDRTVLRKHEVLEKNLRGGHKAVDHLEHKLVRRLLELQNADLPLGPSFGKLQLYSEIWSDLTIDSSIFGELLKEIKEEYDGYLTHLLDSMKSVNRNELEVCLKVAEEVSTEEKIKTADRLHHEVDDLETSCHDALLLNHRLQQEIRQEELIIEEEKRLQQEEDEENIRRMLPLRRSINKVTNKAPGETKAAGFVNLTKKNRLKALRVEIWKKLDEVAEKRQQLRECYVPKLIHRNIQHALKDTEVEMQKLDQQNYFLRLNTQELNEQLTASFQSRILDEDKLRTVWDIIENGDDVDTNSET